MFNTILNTSQAVNLLRGRPKIDDYKSLNQVAEYICQDLQLFRDENVWWHTVFNMILKTVQAVNKLRGALQIDKYKSLKQDSE